MPAIEVNDFSGGMLLDIDPVKLAANQAAHLRNVCIKYGSLEKEPSMALWKSSLPTGLTPKIVKEIEFTLPSTQQVTVLYGKNSTDHQLWIRPYLTLAGAWTDAWQELTEREGKIGSYLNMAAGTTTTSVTTTDLIVTTTDYYKGWILFDDLNATAGIITASTHSAGTWTLTIDKALRVAASGNTFMVMRNPVKDFQGTYLFSPENDHVEIHDLENSFIVLTGSDTSYPAATDLWCGYRDVAQFQDNDLDWKGIYCTRNTLHAIRWPWAAADLAIAAETTDPVPDGTYVVLAIAEYDGYQEGPIFAGAALEHGFQVGKEYPFIVTTAGSNDKITVNFYEYQRYHDNANIRVPLLTENNNPDMIAASNYQDLSHIIFDRRITGYRFYMAAAEQIGASVPAYYQPTEEWRFVRRIPIDASDWTYDGATNFRYDISFDILGRDYNSAADADLAAGVGLNNRQGHTDLHVYGNARTAAVAGERVFYGNLFIDEQRKSYVIGSPTNSDGLNTYSVMPWNSLSFDTVPYGMPEIIKMITVLERVIVIGKNKILRLNPVAGAADFSIAEHYTNIGGLAKNGIVTDGKIVFMASSEGITAYIPQASDVIDTSRVVDISEGAIRETWQGFNLSNRQDAALGFARNAGYLVISGADGTFTFHLQRKNWAYYGTTQYIHFATGIDGELIGVTSAGAVHELFATSPTESTQLEYRSSVFQGKQKKALCVSEVGMTYKSDVALTMEFFDLDWNTTYPVKTLTWQAQSELKQAPVQTINFQAQLLQMRITSTSAATNAIKITDTQIQTDVLE